jgi:hypothetical protein
MAREEDTNSYYDIDNQMDRLIDRQMDKQTDL